MSAQSMVSEEEFLGQLKCEGYVVDTTPAPIESEGTKAFWKNVAWQIECQSQAEDGEVECVVVHDDAGVLIGSLIWDASDTREIMNVAIDPASDVEVVRDLLHRRYEEKLRNTIRNTI